MNVHQKEALLFIAQQYKMHPVAILLANDIKDNEGGWFYDEAAYQLPNWKPQNGWKVDKAFVWALVRQESAFFPKNTLKPS
jgi:soluble lytic murein transglycosylase-like protein